MMILNYACYACYDVSYSDKTYIHEYMTSIVLYSFYSKILYSSQSIGLCGHLGNETNKS